MPLMHREWIASSRLAIIALATETHGLTSSFSSLIESAAVESAAATSTSSMSLEISARDFFHSSTNGLSVVSLAWLFRIPTFFCSRVS